MAVVLAIDLGGGSLRAALVTDAGAITASVSAAHRTGVEADAQAWWTALVALLDALPLEDVRGDIAGVGLSGFTRSQVLVDARGDPVRPAQCFADGRATGEAAALAGAAAGTWGR